MHSWSGDDCCGGFGACDIGSAWIWDDRFVRGDLVGDCWSDVDEDAERKIEISMDGQRAGRRPAPTNALRGNKFRNQSPRRRELLAATPT